MATPGKASVQENLATEVRKAISAHSRGLFDDKLVEAMAQKALLKFNVERINGPSSAEIESESKSVVEAMIEVRKEILDCFSKKSQREILQALVQKTLLQLSTESTTPSTLVSRAKNVIENLLVEREANLRKISERIIEYATSKLGGSNPKQDAEDLSQEAIMVLNKKYPDIFSAEEMVRVAIGITKTLIKAHRRRTGNRPPPAPTGQAEGEMDIVDPIPSEAAVLERLELDELRGRLMAGIGKLDSKCRQLFLFMLDEADYSFVDISHFTNRPVNTIYSRYARCMRKLVRFVKSMGVRK